MTPGRKKMGTVHKLPSGWARPLKNQVPSSRVDRSGALGYSGINKRIIMETKELKRIADAIEEILRLVREDMKEMKKAAK